MRRALAVLLIGFVLAIFGGGDGRADFRAQSLDNDFAAEIANARGQGKHLLLMFHLNSCPYCDKMRERVFPDPRVQEYFSRHFVMLEAEINGDLPVVMPSGEAATEKVMATKYRVRATPVFLYFDQQGHEVARTTGYQDVEAFVRTGQFVVDGVYKSGQSLARYLLAPR